MSEQLDLGFVLEPIPASPKEVDPRSTSQRRTQKQKALIAQGRHPATKLRLLEPVGEHTCGDCVNSYVHGHNVKNYYKCELVPFTFGPGTDIRISWPACTKWSAKEEPEDS